MLEKSDSFKDEFEVIIDFIALDSINRALIFYDEIVAKINQILDNPYIHRRRPSLAKREIDKNLRGARNL